MLQNSGNRPYSIVTNEQGDLLTPPEFDFCSYQLTKSAAAIINVENDVADALYRFSYIGAEISELLTQMDSQNQPAYFAMDIVNRDVVMAKPKDDPLLPDQHTYPLHSLVGKNIGAYMRLSGTCTDVALSHFVVLGKRTCCVSLGRRRVQLQTSRIVVPARLTPDTTLDEKIAAAIGS